VLRQPAKKRIPGNADHPCSLDKTVMRTRHKHDLAGKFVVSYAGNLSRAHEFGTRPRREPPAPDAFPITGCDAKAEGLRNAVVPERLGSFRFKPLQLRSFCPTASDVHSSARL
jgi:hypothetical protein